MRPVALILTLPLAGCNFVIFNPDVPCKSCFADLSLLSELKVTTEKLAVTWCKLNHRKADSRKKCDKKKFVDGNERKVKFMGK